MKLRPGQNGPLHLGPSDCGFPQVQRVTSARSFGQGHPILFFWQTRTIFRGLIYVMYVYKCIYIYTYTWLCIIMYIVLFGRVRRIWVFWKWVNVRNLHFSYLYHWCLNLYQANFNQMFVKIMGKKERTSPKKCPKRHPISTFSCRGTRLDSAPLVIQDDSPPLFSGG